MVVNYQVIIEAGLKNRKKQERKSEITMKQMALLLVAVSLFLASPVMAADGRTLKHYCGVALLSKEEHVSSVGLLEDFNICVSKVNTVFETISEFQRIVDVKQPNAFSCVPDKVGLIERIRLVYTFLEEHPDKINLNDVILIMEAIAEAFPCSEPQPEK